MEEDKSFMVAAAVQSTYGDTLLWMLSCENEGKNITPLDVWKRLKAARERACKPALTRRSKLQTRWYVDQWFF